MPEGDTIHRTADALRRVLLGHALTRVELPRHGPPLPSVGADVTRIEARGKHLLIGTSDGLVVHTHQRMTGSWHVYGPRDRWRKSPRAARVILGVDHAVAVCFSSPVVEVLDHQALRRHPTLRRLGPDLCDPGADIDEAAARLDRLVDTDRSIGEALLDQRVACGVGNVYRCEVLFLHGLDPSTPVRAVDTATRRQLLGTAAHLLRANLDDASRTTVDSGAPGELWVHGRRGEPCRRCATPIRIARLGEQARYVYWCPTCQPPRPAVGGDGRRADAQEVATTTAAGRSTMTSMSRTSAPARPTVPPAQLAAWRSLLEAHARTTELLAAELRDEHDLPLAWYDVLLHLNEAPDRRLRMQELAGRILLSKSGLTRLIDRMEREGLVARTACPSDRRGTFAELTPTGHERLRETAPTHLRGVREHVADLLDDDEAATLERLLRRIADAASSR